MVQATALLDDAEQLARTVFDRSDDAERILGLLRYSVSVVDRLAEPRPDHDEWRRIAVIVQLLVCSQAEARNALASQAKRRLSAFIDENADLLDFATPLHALALVN
ncbi:MAG: hypothetical protein JO165_09095 [Candidatus Eremiobacteraeota bacterium]|nr:hypothetical protein [Candidatus Eremiobacteraeota bacterium]